MGSNNRAGLEDATNTTTHGNQRLRVQWWKAPDDGHSGVRNMYSNVECNKYFMILKRMCIWLVFIQFYNILIPLSKLLCQPLQGTSICHSSCQWAVRKGRICTYHVTAVGELQLSDLQKSHLLPMVFHWSKASFDRIHQLKVFGCYKSSYGSLGAPIHKKWRMVHPVRFLSTKLGHHLQ
jgi:hypothetical protein